MPFYVRQQGNWMTGWQIFTGILTNYLVVGNKHQQTWLSTITAEKWTWSNHCWFKHYRWSIYTQ